MSDDTSVSIDKLQQAIAALETQQRELEIDHSQKIAELQQRLDDVRGISQQGSGATATHGGVAGGEGSVVVGHNVYGDINVNTVAAPQSPQHLREAYLSWLSEQVRAVALTGVDPKSMREDTRRDLDLAAVYTALLTQRTQAEEDRQLSLDRDQERLSALAVLNIESRLALLGDPGSGKSTFVNFVALCMAGELLKHPDANLAVLCAPVPEEETSRRIDEDSPPHPQPWHHGPLLPIRVVLREFVARGLTADSSDQTKKSDPLWQFIIAELPEPLRDFAGPLRTELLDKGGIVLLDGLDEVPEADQRRVQVKAAIEQFSAAFSKVRILATSRIYAYQKQDWKLKGFSEAVLAPFGPAQIHRFVERWYAFVGQARGLTEDDWTGRAVLLNNAISNSARLSELATRPLLLTLMASLHAWRGGTLPDQREELYADAVNLLLDQWESQKVRRLQDGSPEVIQPSLVEWLKTDRDAVRRVLNQLAFEAHRDQQNLVGTADIAQDRLVSGLMALNLNPDARPKRLIEHVSDRAGLLEPRGVGIYAFPHRTFQEYLAACCLTEQDEFPDNIADLLRAEPNRWREVTLLAGAKAVRGAAANAWLLAEALCFQDLPAEKRGEEAGYWGALLAAQILKENKSLAQVAERNQNKLKRIRGWLACTLAHNALPAVDRAQAGDGLAAVGDPRFRADAWGLPAEELLGFVEIPEGEFLMGEDEDRHALALPSYYMARYPVTVAQFQKFVKEKNHPWAGKNRPQGPDNHPVVYVSWHDALAYCQWLTEQLRTWQETPEPLATLLRQEGWQITLPSEAEWEKAARGQDGRGYPWGEEFDSSKANVAETNIRTTSAVGCFPSGASPYGIMDLSGNVWEWTRSLYKQYPYPNDRKGRAQRENLEVSEDEPRVVRGGGFFDSQRDVRCAVRGRLHPVDGHDNGGFRVVVLPNSEL